jgi:hypothetical protein
MLSWSSLPAQQPAAAGPAMPRSQRINHWWTLVIRSPLMKGD